MSATPPAMPSAGWLLAGSMLLTISLTAQERPTSDWPSPRGGAHAMAYDARRGLTLLYGDRGADAAVLWGWDGTRWQAFPGSGPGIRRHIKLAYDASRDRLVLFGGLDDSGRLFYADTWEWDGSAWTQVATTGPSGRASYAMTYDPATSRVLLFGGLGREGPLADLWAWDGRQWQQLARDGGPSPRTEAGMLPDRTGSGIIVSGGSVFEQVTVEGGGRTLRIRVLPDSWRWDAVGWRRVAEVGPGRSFTALVEDPRSGEPLRIGGESDSAFEGDMASWHGDHWSSVAGAGVPPRHGVAAALDTRRGRVVIYGGSAGSRQSSTALGDLLEWDGARWIEIPRPGSP